ncbi:MAG TPA: radical SAM protein, partial [Bacillota bacterium]|nr:radical SAM protein [Bacillota bacterium]
TEELIQACEVIQSVDRQIPLIIQPVTPPPESHLAKPDPATLLNMHALCRQFLKDVRVIPQTHKMLGLL